jgi:thermitase
MNFESLYPFAWIAGALSIVWLFYQASIHKNKSIAFFSFLGSCVFYSFILYFTQFGTYYKFLFMLPRDVLGWVLIFILSNRIKHTKGFFWTAISVGAGGYFVYSQSIFGIPFSKILPDYFKENKEISKNTSKNTSKNDQDGELLVDMKEVGNKSALLAVIKKYKASFSIAFPDVMDKKGTFLDDYILINLPENANIDAFTKELLATNAIDDVENNEIVSLSPLETTPNTAPITQNKATNDPRVAEQWHIQQFQPKEYFELFSKKSLKPKKKAKIAILDTGVDAGHEDLKGNFVSIDPKSDKDRHSHGTHCAGIASGVANNGIGIASFIPSNDWVQVSSVKVLNDNGGGTQAGIIRGILKAVDSGVDVISMSLGGYSTDRAQRAYNEAFRYAKSKGVIVVVAAGNESQNAKNVVPANCKDVIVVTALTAQNQKADFSNTIEDLKMGISAPGHEILSTIPKNGYASYSGTSMATPFVAGLLGMMKAIRPDIDVETAHKILVKTGKDTPQTNLTGKCVIPLAVIKELKK